MFGIRNWFPLLLLVFMAPPARVPSSANNTEGMFLQDVGDSTDDAHSTRAEEEVPTAHRNSRPRNVAISDAATRTAPPAAHVTTTDPAVAASLSHISETLAHLSQALLRNGTRGTLRDSNSDASSSDSDDDSAGTDDSQAASSRRLPRRIPPSDLLPHLPRRKFRWWTTHASGTPIPWKKLPAQLRSAIPKDRSRDRTEAEFTFSALSLSLSVLDALVAIGEGHTGLVHNAAELILNHMVPLLCRRVDALQQESALRSAFAAAQDPRSHFFVADPETTTPLLQKVNAAKVQNFLTAASRVRTHDSNDRGSNHNRRGNHDKQRGSAGGSQGTQSRNRNTSNANAGGSTRRAGNSRERSDSRARGNSREAPASRSTPADAAARGADRN